MSFPLNVIFTISFMTNKPTLRHCSVGCHSIPLYTPSLFDGHILLHPLSSMKKVGSSRFYICPHCLKLPLFSLFFAAGRTHASHTCIELPAFLRTVPYRTSQYPARTAPSEGADAEKTSHPFNPKNIIKSRIGQPLIEMFVKIMR